MEEEKNEKASTKKKAAKDSALKKVNKLLAGTGLEDKEDDTPVFTPPIQDDEFMQISSNDQATNWLNEQVAGLTQQVEDYQKQIVKLKNDNQILNNMLNGGGGAGTVTTDSASQAKIVELYKHFEGVYNGKKYGQRFDTAKLSYPQSGSGVLDVLLSIFPFLHNVKEYAHRDSHM